jgi:lysophospholipase L1-like esterase
MNRMSRLLARFLLVFFLAASAAADAPDPDPERFAGEIAAFMAWDRKNAFPERGMLFVGSSSIRLWETATAFPGEPIVNRGFGGSELSDVIAWYDQVIRPYAPQKILVYAGDNDIAGGKTAGQVFEDYRQLVAKVKADFPATELVFLSIKPSRLRWAEWPEMLKANALVQRYADRHPGLGYVDLAAPLLDAAGQPKDVYLEDGLHLNEHGYALWREALAPLL